VNAPAALRLVDTVSLARVKFLSMGEKTRENPQRHPKNYVSRSHEKWGRSEKDLIKTGRQDVMDS